MKCYLDANVLVYFKREDSPFHKESVRCVGKLIEEEFDLLISSLVLDEFIWSFQKGLNFTKYGLAFTRQKALKEIMFLPRLKIVSTPVEKKEQMKVLKFMDRYSLHPRDAYHLLTMKYNRIDHFLTFDNDFKKVFKAKLVLSARELI